jgi:hypothetical protein
VWSLGLVLFEIATRKDPWHPAADAIIIDNLRCKTPV